MNKLSHFIRENRTSKKLSVRKLAELASISHTEIHRLENGERKNPSPRLLKAIAKPLGVTYEDIMKAAGYIEKVISRGKYEDVVWEEKDGIFVDTYRRAIENIVSKDAELISILDRAVDKSSGKDIETIKKLLTGFMDGSLSEIEKTTLSTIIDSFSKK